MRDTTIEHNENEPFATEISDEVLEAAGSACNGAYTQFAYCTQVACPFSPRLNFSHQEAVDGAS